LLENLAVQFQHHQHKKNPNGDLGDGPPPKVPVGVEGLEKEKGTENPESREKGIRKKPPVRRYEASPPKAQGEAQVPVEGVLQAQVADTPIDNNQRS
jgi:hypothetical protein